VGCPTNTHKGFFENFNNSTYQIPLSSGSGQDSDLNAVYSHLYYSIKNLENLVDTGVLTHWVELILVGSFPDARYFSITGNDMHYASTQHLADADMDPVGVSAGNTYQNPFTPNTPYSPGQQFEVPIGLGYVPGTVVKGCGIQPFEEDNLLDATQRHLSMDWNTAPPNTPGATIGSAHYVDYPDHSNPNTAGVISIRTYLPPVVCSGGPSNCSLSPDPAAAANAPYLILRDVSTGCAYNASWVQQHLMYPAVGAQTAMLSLPDLSKNNPNWLSYPQLGLHTTYAKITPEACWANGATPNKVAWTRSPEFLGTPGPDDSYIGGSVAAGTVPSGNVIRFQFQLPVMPTTPYSGTLSGSEQLRYMSLTFGYQPVPPASLDPAYVTDVDGISSAAGPSSTVTTSLISLADSAFAKNPDGLGNNYATLLVSLDGNLPSWLALAAGTGVANGVGAGWHISSGGNTVWSVANCNLTYAVWKVNGYTVLDLSQFTTCIPRYPRSGINKFNPATMPLLMTIRETLPNMQQPTPFDCSAAAVPFSTAEYTSGGGLMGPYVPQVDYVDPNTLSRTGPVVPTLPPTSACGSLPSGVTPGTNSPSTSSPLNWPEAYWPGSSSPFTLSCGSTSAPLPQIQFVATQFSEPVTAWANTNGQNCTSPIQSNMCSQIVLQETQTTELVGQAPWTPGTPMTILGSGFGYLPNSTLPLAASGSQYVLISHCPSGKSCPQQYPYDWDTNSSSCQVYIANWTDTSISLIPGLSLNVYDGYGILLSPLTDVSPMTFPSAGACPVATGDTFTFTVTSPQGGTPPATSPPIPVSATVTPLH
jgi:hypothetical protein